MSARLLLPQAPRWRLPTTRMLFAGARTSPPPFRATHTVLYLAAGGALGATAGVVYKDYATSNFPSPPVVSVVAEKRFTFTTLTKLEAEINHYIRQRNDTSSLLGKLNTVSCYLSAVKDGYRVAASVHSGLEILVAKVHKIWENELELRRLCIMVDGYIVNIADAIKEQQKYSLEFKDILNELSATIPDAKFTLPPFLVVEVELLSLIARLKQAILKKDEAGLKDALDQISAHFAHLNDGAFSDNPELQAVLTQCLATLASVPNADNMKSVMKIALDSAASILKTFNSD
eukprot:m.267327 g.267327  ORF g.267327 m.267327 type:complete len:289 (+) comp32801_c0_seq1:10-876(+)